MRWTARPWIVAILAAALTTLAPAVEAQQRGPGRRPGRAELEGRVRAQFGRMVRERLALTPEQATRLGEIVDGFREDRMRLAQEDEALRARTRALILEGGDSEAEARDILDRLHALRLEEARLFRSEQEALLEVLSPSQVLQFHTLREQMGQRIRQLRGGPGPPGGRRPVGDATLPLEWGR
jgi:Spy/CpxP family protein refolding chaperone